MNSSGYYQISTRKNGNHRKILHRLIFEDNYNVTILPGVHVHHKDHNRLNNNIENLELIMPSKHLKMHFSGIPKNMEEKINKSKSTTSSGIFNVLKNKNNISKNGFNYQYQYSVEGKRKRISSEDLFKLKERVLNKGLEWIVVNEEKAHDFYQEALYLSKENLKGGI